MLEERARSALIGWRLSLAGARAVVVATTTRPVQIASDTDHRRHNALVLDDWRVLPIGWWRFEADWKGSCAELSRLLQR